MYSAIRLPLSLITIAQWKKSGGRRPKSAVLLWRVGGAAGLFFVIVICKLAVRIAGERDILNSSLSLKPRLRPRIVAPDFCDDQF